MEARPKRCTASANGPRQATVWAVWAVIVPEATGPEGLQLLLDPLQE